MTPVCDIAPGQRLPTHTTAGADMRGLPPKLKTAGLAPVRGSEAGRRCMTGHLGGAGFRDPCAGHQASGLSSSLRVLVVVRRTFVRGAARPPDASEHPRCETPTSAETGIARIPWARNQRRGGSCSTTHAPIPSTGRPHEVAREREPRAPPITRRRDLPPGPVVSCHRSRGTTIPSCVARRRTASSEPVPREVSARRSCTAAIPRQVSRCRLPADLAVGCDAGPGTRYASER